MMLLVCGFYLDFTVSISFCKAKKQFFVKVKVRKDDDLAIIFLCCICEIDRIKNTRVIPYLKWDSSCRHAWISKGASYRFKIMDHEMNIGHCKEWASLVLQWEVARFQRRSFRKISSFEYEFQLLSERIYFNITITFMSRKIVYTIFILKIPIIR